MQQVASTGTVRPKFKIGDVIYHPVDGDICLIKGMNYLSYHIICIKADKDGYLEVGREGKLNIKRRDPEYVLHENTIIDKLLEKYS